MRSRQIGERQASSQQLKCEHPGGAVPNKIFSMHFLVGGLDILLAKSLVVQAGTGGGGGGG